MQHKINSLNLMNKITKTTVVYIFANFKYLFLFQKIVKLSEPQKERGALLGACCEIKIVLFCWPKGEEEVKNDKTLC